MHGLVAPASTGTARKPRALSIVLIVTQIAALLFIVTLLMLARIGHIPFAQVTRDPATAFNGFFLTGYLSYMGACLWCAAASVALFSGFVVRKSARVIASDRRASFLLATGFLSGVLLVDDLFMMHDGLIPYLAGWRDVEPIVLGIYLIAGLVWLFKFRALIFRTAWSLLVISGCFFALMVAVDQGILKVAEARRHLFEDGPKFMGIANWAVWVIGTCVALTAKPDTGQAVANENA
jgi:hypothetical protein